MLKFGDKDIPSLFYGSVPVIKAYYGTEQVWPSQPQYIPVEWIETDGVTSYIDTGIVPAWKKVSDVNQVSEITLDFRLMTLPTDTNQFCICGARYGSSSREIYFGILPNLTSNRLTLLRPTTGTSVSVIEIDRNRHSITMAYPTATMDGVQITSTALITGELQGNFMIGCSGNPSLWPIDPANKFQPANVRVYGCKIVTGGVTVFDAIPVRIGNEGGLYDRISGRVIRNSGGGRIMPGPPLEVPYDYEVEYIQRDTSITWKEGGTNVIGGFDLSAYIPQGQTMQDGSNCEVTWSFDGTTANVFYAFQYWNTIFASLNMWKGSGVNVYSFTTPSSGRTEVVGNLSAFHKQEIKRTGAGQYDLVFDNALFNGYTTTSTGRIAVAKVMGGGTSSATGEGEKRFRVMRATFGDNVFLIPVVKGNQMGFYNTLDGQMFLAEQECLSPGKEIGAPYTKEVEYLESTGTQWIDTGLLSQNDIAYQVLARATQYRDQAIYGSIIQGNAASNNRVLFYNTNGIIAVQRGSYNTSRQIPADLNWHTYYSSKDIIQIDSYTFSGASCSAANGKMSLFASSGAIEPLSSGYMQIGRSKIFLANTLVRDFIPVRFLNENGQQEGAMYDKVSKQLFRNKGTGSFTIGPDKI